MPHMGILLDARALIYWLQCAIEFAVKAGALRGDYRHPALLQLLAEATTSCCCTAQCLGLPSSMCNGWACFLEHNVRTFCVRQQYGHLHHSTSGVPEGDNLSCIGMLLKS